MKTFFLNLWFMIFVNVYDFLFKKIYSVSYVILDEENGRIVTYGTAIVTNYGFNSLNIEWLRTDLCKDNPNKGRIAIPISITRIKK